MKTTCSEGRCPQPITLDKETERMGLCYFHVKVAAGLIVDRLDESGQLVAVVLP